ncbi:hypothetical protein LguiB_009899 [Lonicera macranthoides]
MAFCRGYNLMKLDKDFLPEHLAGQQCMGLLRIILLCFLRALILAHSQQESSVSSTSTTIEHILAASPARNQLYRPSHGIFFVPTITYAAAHMERTEERKLRSNIKIKGRTKRRNEVKFANVD